MTSRAVIFHAADRELELRRLPTPEPQPGEILTRVLGCTLCGSDLHTYTGRRSTPTPTVLGHEIVGEIVAFGEHSPSHDIGGLELQVGRRVTWAVVASCGGCFFCLRGLPQKCEASWKYGHQKIEEGRLLSGGLADHCVLAPHTAVARLPDDVALAAVCPASCATATVAAALSAAGELRDRSVCVLGLGLLGLTAAAMLQVAGASVIVCVDLDERRRRRAIDFGATDVVGPAEVEPLVGPATGGYGFDVVLELSGSNEAVECGVRRLRLGGTIVLVGSVSPTEPIAISPEQLVRRNLSIHGVHNYTPEDLRTAILFLTEHHERFPFGELVTRWYPLEAAAEAFAVAARDRPVRIGVRPE